MIKPYNHVALIETAGNQRTIFQTNRLRDNVGASELIHRVGSDFVPKAREDRDMLPLVEASGKAILLARDDKDAEAVIEAVTRRTLAECPGVTARGAVVPIDAWTTQDLNKAIGLAHRRLADLAAELPAPVARFARLPFVEDCVASGYPAAEPDPDPNLAGAVSAVGLAKRRARAAAWRRMTGAADGPRGALADLRFFRKMDEFEDEALDSDWVGIVHADGNGLGQVFLNLVEYLPEGVAPETYCETLRAFSAAIDAWSRAAAAAAILATWPETKVQDGPKVSKRAKHPEKPVARVPVIPVVLGGDDLTVICEGERAVRFAANYLMAFEEQSRTALKGDLGDRMPGLRGWGAVAAAAGVAIVKPHFPFHRAYELAEGLTKSAKTVKRHVVEEVAGKEIAVPCSALDFQVLFDTSGADLDLIRGRMRGPGGEHLTMRPYVVTPLARLAGKKGEGWAGRRHYSEGGASLTAAVGALLKRRTDEDRDDPAHLPRTQQHALHDALYHGRDIADARLRLIEQRYGRFDWDSVTARAGDAPRSLFIKDAEMDEAGGKKARWGARLLDALEVADLGGEEALDAKNNAPDAGEEDKP